ncbi:hypothetical protein GGP41_007544 [Bipolaris sorokiniana]|uniref:Carboxylic ester hydrolase n=1 Tax=Cochliobolus sativus TaxID=45130 RepID=A0A8H5Z6J2_COCSA|nr:hypothetical protein GGP41_007544 [Bipolaris sorokiniana]
MIKHILLASLTVGALARPAALSDIKRSNVTNLNVKISVANGLLDTPTDGRIVLMFAPAGTNPLDDTDVTSSPNKIFGKNVYGFGSDKAVTLSGGSNDSTATGVFGWPNPSLDNIDPGTYSVQAFLTRYETVTRSDGSKVSLRFPCGDVPNFNGKEIGGCNQGNYEDTEFLKHIKIRSKKLSKFWGRDMYVGANIVLPAGYNANDTKTRYPVIYHQNHWTGGFGAYKYGENETFTSIWDKGIIPATDSKPERPVPKFITVAFRHEAPYYDDSYAVNTANLGPYGDALNDELLPYIDQKFNTIRSPYARIQDGGSTGGWESIANVIYRPDLFGACFSSYPDSLSFYRHQDIALYTASNAYTRDDGTAVPSIRTFVNGTQVIEATVASENHWELTFGTSSRSFNQWDVWNAVFGVQGYNNYPLEPWDKVTGEIYPHAIAYWKQFDLTEYIIANFKSSRNLGTALADRLFVYVGSWDTYFLNEGVQEFRDRTDEVGGKGWANVTILPEKTHGGNYQDRDIWEYLELVEGWVKVHAPGGPKSLCEECTAPSTRGNVWDEVIKYGGRNAAVQRQADPRIEGADKVSVGQIVRANVGRWDPGVKLTAQWILNSKPACETFAVKQGANVTYTPTAKGHVQLLVTGEKRNYATETRKSQRVLIGR